MSASVYSVLYKAYSLEELAKIKEERTRVYKESLAAIDTAITQMLDGQKTKAYETLITAEPTITMPITNNAGRKVGRPRSECKGDLSMDDIRRMVRLRVPPEEIAKDLGISRATFYRRMKNSDYVPGNVMFSSLTHLLE